ncbi:hypothetical protein ACA910_022711 [Epithemia clementina (nom. ined.)]
MQSSSNPNTGGAAATVFGSTTSAAAVPNHRANHEGSNDKNHNNRDDPKTESSPFDLESILEQAFPGAIQSYEIVQTIVQANANGYIVQLNDSMDTCAKRSATIPCQVFIKQVKAADYVATKKDWPDLRRTLCYARTEARFYNRTLPLLQNEAGTATTSGGTNPKAYLATYNFQDWIAEDDHATAAAADPNLDIRQLPNPQERGGALVLEYISPDLYYQESPLSTLEDCQRCLDAVAALHSAAWQNVNLLQAVDRDLSKASFHLSVRNPKELAGCISTWQGFLQAFQSDLQAAGLWQLESIQQLGKRVAQAAQYVSQQVSPQPNDHYATLIHGDYKSMNVFLPKTTIRKECASENDSDLSSTTATAPPRSAILVDFASAGLGLGASDVAMHIHHAVRPEQLAHGGEEKLLRYYWNSLRRQQRQEQEQQAGATTAGVVEDENTHWYPWTMLVRHYRLAVVDYFRFFMARMWKNATPEAMEQKKDNPNVNLINRSPQAAMAFIQRVDQYLTEIEQNEGQHFL